MPRKRGPKTEPGLEVRPVTLSLDEMTLRKARALRPGNVSRAVRDAIHAAYDRWQREPTGPGSAPPGG